MTQHPPVAVVTGAASGIGAACARELSERGWAVAGLDRADTPDVDLAVGADVSDAAQVSSAVRRVAAELGTPAAVVSAAGHYEITALDAISREAWNRMLRVHLGGTANICRAVLPGMLDAGHGAIVGVTSEIAIGGGDGEAHYAAAKGAVIGLLRSLAAEYAEHGIRVNAVAPGPTDTPLLPPDSPWRDPDYLAGLPARRLATPEEVALTAAFLIEEATFCCGEVLSPSSGAVI